MVQKCVHIAPTNIQSKTWKLLTSTWKQGVRSTRWFWEQLSLFSRTILKRIKIYAILLIDLFSTVSSDRVNMNQVNMIYWILIILSVLSTNKSNTLSFLLPFFNACWSKIETKIHLQINRGQVDKFTAWNEQNLPKIWQNANKTAPAD